MGASTIRDKLMTALPPLPAFAQRAADSARGLYYNTTPVQRMVAGSVAAIVLVVGVAALSLSSHSKPHAVSVAAPALTTKLTLSAPKKPTLNEPAPVPVTAPEETMSIPLAEQLRTLQNAPVKLEPVPIEDLTVATPSGLLPKIGSDGRLPWQAYARPTPPMPAGTPRLAVMMIDMGLSERLTGPAFEQLPGQVTMALNGQSPRLAEYVTMARERGHEVVLDIPAEPRFYPEEDPGPTALMTRIGNDENIKRLRSWLAKAPGALGITTLNGTQYVTDAAAMTPVINELKLRGLAWVDTGAERGVGNRLADSLNAATATVNLDLDSVLTPSAIRAQFEKAVGFAREHESVLLVARPYPLTVSLLNELLGGLPDAGVALVPASALLVASLPRLPLGTPAAVPSAAPAPAPAEPSEAPHDSEQH